jgi:hypothetical protein
LIAGRGPTQERAEIAHGAKVLEFVRVDDRNHGSDLSSRDIESHHADQLSFGVERDRARLTVHLDLLQHASGNLETPFHPGHESAGDAAAAVEGSRSRRRLPAAVAAQHDVMGE